MLSNIVIAIMALGTLGLVGCGSSRSVTAKPRACQEVAKEWAGNNPGIQGQAQGDGGIIFIKPGIDHLELLVIASELHAPKVVNELRQGQAQRTIGTYKEGVCSHPQNGYTYRTFEFQVTPPK